MIKFTRHEQSFPIANLAESPRAREDLGDITELAQSIQKIGLLNPILVESRTNRLLAGGRRVEAFLTLKRKTIPAVLVEAQSWTTELEIELWENRHRKGMLWWEEAKIEAELHKIYMKENRRWTQEKTARALGISPGELSKRLSLIEYLDAVPEIRKFETAKLAVAAVERVVGDTIARKEAEKIVGQEREEQEDSDFVSLALPGESNEKESASRNKEKEAKKEKADKGETKEENVFFYKSLFLSSYRTGDALSEMSGCELKSFHLAEVDPPYGVALRKNRRSADPTALARYNEIAKSKYPSFLRETAKHVFNLLRDDTFCIWWFGEEWQESVRNVLTTTGFTLPSSPAIWFKGRGQTNSPETTLANSYESFFLARKGSPSLRRKGVLNVFSVPGVYGKTRYHPTQRPFELMEELILLTTGEHANILVPFLGSGVTLQAAFYHNRLGIGWDLDETFKNHYISRMPSITKHGTDA